jgi:hypothetical protein
MAANGTHNDSSAPTAVNRKKQKRREKEAAKRAAQEPPAPSPARNGVPPALAEQYADPELDNAAYDEGDYYSDEDFGTNGDYQQGSAGKKPRRTKKALAYTRHDSRHSPAPAHTMRPGHAPIPPGMRSGSSKDRIWNTSTEEERERIREFWLSLGEDERKSLVKIEKEAVLRKMKEQQKHSCSCTVCGRKRTAIEEELEVLYDAYYEELEQYAHHQQDPTVGSFIPEANYGCASSAPHPRPILNTQPPPGAYDDDEEEYDSAEEEEEDSEYDSEISSEGGYSSGEPSLPPPEPSDFFRFGSSLQVKGMLKSVLVLGAC